MDWRGRKYYIVTFYFDSYDMRMSFLKLIPNIKFTYYKNIPKQRDELEERGNYQFMIGVPNSSSEAVEYELRKAERNDYYCKWKEIKQDLSKKYLDVFGNPIPYRRCDINPSKRCNHCMNC